MNVHENMLLKNTLDGEVYILLKTSNYLWGLHTKKHFNNVVFLKGRKRLTWPP